ncbi:hypothetical protein DPMN_000535 [Dreissena polymorpha]|uniref:Uncharacterized protein n=1 Tax=Dreissena polymorpha TaxID=45954 RepID=A0A9D4MJX6_DREPO|nr:hypothetical protein DPMN_000535 [Dreissena polymorpha]
MIISRHVEEATRRYQSVDQNVDKISSYSLRLRLSILDGVRNVYNEFAAKQAAENVELQQRVIDVIISNDVTIDESDSGFPSDHMIVTSETSVNGSEFYHSFEMCS